MNIPIIFLDFDGVLNSVSWAHRRPSKIEWALTMNISPEEFTHDRISWAMRSIDPEAVAALEAIVQRSRARVVVSSTWRTMYTLSRLEEMLRFFGFTGHLVGATPDRWTLPARDGERLYRGDEIDAWLRAMFTAPPTVDVSFVILDDDSDMGLLSPRLYQTDVECGLIADDIEPIAELLANPTATARRLVRKKEPSL